MPPVGTGTRTGAPAVQTPTEAPPRARGVTLRALMKRATQSGHPRLPPFVAVHLLQRLCASMEQVTGLPEGRVTLDSITCGFDGTFQFEGSEGAPADTIALASLFEPLGGIPPDDLALVLATALRGELDGPRTLAQRLGHWLARQRQPPGGMDPGVALLAWLFPDEAPVPPPLPLAEWFAHERTTETVIARRPTGLTTDDAVDRATQRKVLIGLGVLVLGLISVLTVVSLREDEHLPPRPVDLAKTVPALPVQKPQQAPTLGEVPAPTPSLPHSAHGVPARFVLSFDAHGIDLQRAGREVKAPGPKWSARTSFAFKAPQLPPYAWLYAAEFADDGTFLRLTTVGPEWTALESAKARFFVMQPDHPPDQGSFDLALASGINGQRVLGERLRNVFGEALTQQEGTRFILDELNPAESYLVTVQRPARGPAPLIIMSATQPRAWMYSGTAIHEKGPMLQTLLTPGVPFRVKGVSRLSFVVLGVVGDATQYAVNVVSSKDVGKAASTDASAHYRAGEQAFLRGDLETAVNELTRCKQLDPKSSICSDLLVQARRLFEEDLKK